MIFGRMHSLHARIQEFLSGGGGGGPVPTAIKQPGQRFFFFFFFFPFSPQLILRFTEGIQWFYYRENYTFPSLGSRGSNLFPEGGGGAGGGPSVNFCRNPYNL